VEGVWFLAEEVEGGLGHGCPAWFRGAGRC
jgi:hypothetical protein